MTPLAVLVLSGLVALTAFAILWTVYWVAGLTATPGDTEWDLAAVQVRVFTVGDAPGVVQGTVDAVPDGVDSVFVVSEQPIAVEGATVRVVPEAFESDAIGKGRALEWARQHLPCDAEYVLFLDEDTRMVPIDGLPDADIVQFAERPEPSGSLPAWLTEVFRVGTGVERAGFARLVPLYAWGGALAVRATLEDDIGWNRPTIEEDGAFVRAAMVAGHSYAVEMARFRNQAPPSLGTLVGQRRRWVSGRLRAAWDLPPWYGALVSLHTLGILLSAFAVPLVVAGFLFAPVSPLFPALATVILGYLLAWSVLGWRQFDTGVGWLGVQLLALPLTSVANALGHVVALVAPVSTFETTRKTDDESEDAVEPADVGERTTDG